ncbi:17245_t:CDS:2, partial [Dentiscutata erythropus]
PLFLACSEKDIPLSQTSSNYSEKAGRSPSSAKQDTLKKIYRLTGAVGEKQSIGSFSDIPVTIGIENDTLTISDEFSVLPTEKDNNGNDISLFILGTRWQHRAGWEPIVKGEFTASANGKTITIPLSVYNKNEEAKLRISNSLKKK